MIYDIIIIGAGASGLMCAANLPKHKKVLLIESNPTIGKKIAISGGGKCNITNIDIHPSYYLGDATFIQQTLQKFTNKDLLNFFTSKNIHFELRKNKYYFCKTSAKDIVNLLKNLTKKHTFAFNTTVTHVEKQTHFLIYTTSNTYKTKKLIVASGGASFPSIGGSDIAIKIAKTFQIPHTPFEPALVGLTLQKEQWWMKELSGVSLFATVSIAKKQFSQNILFAHKGISGPAILNSSLYWKKGNITINFLPKKNITSLLKGKKHISSTLPLPKRFTKKFLQHLHIKDKPCNLFSQKEKQQLQIFHNYSFAPAGTFGFSKAEVSRGGIACDAIKENFETKTIKDLYFLAETLDVTGEVGGYNFQWAFSSGYICAKSILAN